MACDSELVQQHERSAAALRMLSDTSAQLVETLNYAEVLAKVGAISVPALADWCVVDVMDNGDLRPVAWAHKDPTKAWAVQRLHRRYPIGNDATQPHGQVLRTNKSVLISEVTDDVMRISTRDDEHLRRLRSLDPRSLMLVPLVARVRTIGVVTFATTSSRRRRDLADLALAEEVMRRFGLALDNARLYRELQEALQRQRERDRQLRMVFRHVPGAVWAIDRNLRVTYVTGRLVDAAGVEERKLVGLTAYDFLGIRDPADPAIARQLAALHGERQSFEYHYRGRWYSVLVDPLRDKKEHIVGCVGVAFDITESRDVAEQLARSERQLREAQRVAHVGSFEWEIRPNRLTWSDELQRIYGFEPGQFAGTFEAFMQQVPSDEGEATRQIIFDAYTRTSPFTYDHRIVRADGTVRVLHSRGDVIKDDQGNPIRMVGTCWDVTEQKALIRKLEHAVSRWEATVNATAEGILVVDLEGKVVSVNRRFLSLWGVQAHSVEGMNHMQLLSTVLGDLEDDSVFLSRSNEIYAHIDQESFDVIRFRDGRIIERYSTPQRIGSEIAGRVWSLRDVTERERLLHRALYLADATRLLASLEVEQALDGVAHLSVPFLGDGCAIDLFGDGGPRRVIALSRNPRKPISPEVHPTVLSGHSIIYAIDAISYLGVPLLMKGHLVGVITLAAAPDRKYTATDVELAEELARRAALAIDNARLYRSAREALRARDDFLSIAAHEIRGPINSIHLAMQSIRQAKVPERALPTLFEIVERQDRRLSQFVDELLDLGRIRSGRLQLEYEDVNLGDVIRDVAVRFGADLSHSGSSLTVTAPGQVIGQWDKSRLDQIVSNLLSNAIKFGLGRPIELTIGTRDGSAVLLVQDHGTGIEPDVRARLFKPFERGVSVRHYGGLGLGLHIVKTLVDALGGQVSFSSEPGVGSTFMVELPCTRAKVEHDAHPDSR